MGNLNLITCFSFTGNTFSNYFTCYLKIYKIVTCEDFKYKHIYGMVSVLCIMVFVLLK